MDFNPFRKEGGGRSDLGFTYIRGGLLTSN
jgi:hypothetical protein